MTASGPRRLVIGRLRKPHGLKGEFTVFPLTDHPDTAFAAGARLWRVDLAGEALGEVEVESAKAYHREWMLRFRGTHDRTELDGWRGQFLATDADRLPPPAEGEVYLHELEGFSVRDEQDAPLGLVTGVYELPAGLTIEVQGPRREFLLPFKQEFVRTVDRAGRRLVVRVPDGLLD